jgi:hypothetical protein
MGLFDRKRPLTGAGDGAGDDSRASTGAWTPPPPVDPATLLPPAGLDIRAILALPAAEHDSRYSRQMGAALDLAIAGDRTAAEPALRALVGSSNPVDAWCSRLELATLFMDDEPSESFYAGMGLLVQCLDAPFLDVVANAAWNIAEVLKLHGSAEAHRGFAQLAIDLRNPMALCVEGERALEADDRDRAIELWQTACEAIPRTQSLRTRAEVQLAELWLESASDDVRQWFSSALGSLPAEAWAECVPIYRNPGAVFNVEAGAASISTHYFHECPKRCYFEPETVECPICWRGPRRTLRASSGNGDGVYPVLTLHAPDGDTVGAITVFKDGMDALRSLNYQAGDGVLLNASVGGLGATLADLLSAAAPMVLGSLEATDLLLFSDASRCSGDQDYTVDVEVPAGEYIVVAWVTVPTTTYDHTPRPLALAAVTGPLRQAIADCVPALDPDHRHALIEQMWGRPDLMVHSHIGNVRVEVAQVNYDADEASGDPRAISWFLQLAEFDDAGTHDVLRSMEPWDDEQLRSLLAQRGIFGATLPWRAGAAPASGPASSSGAGLLTKTTSGLGLPTASAAESAASEYPEVDPRIVAGAEAGDIFAWNDLGYALVHEGRVEEGLRWLERSARAGVPWAMASFNWRLLLEDDPARAVAVFDEALQSMEAFVQMNAGKGESSAFAAGQLVNARSNDALCRLALGGPPSAALAVWSAARWSGHAESAFHPAVLAYRSGDADEAGRIVAALSDGQRAEIIDTLTEVTAEGSGWFADWCRDGLALLAVGQAQSAPPSTAAPSSSPALPEARFCGACGAPRAPGARFCISCGAAF